jgi:methylated-DNA-[protein]-cysteine S-methyltransferase
MPSELESATRTIDLSRYDALMATPFATIGVRTDDSHLLEVRLLPTSVAPRAPRKNSLAHLAVTELALYVENARYPFSVPLKLAGTRHELQVWEAMQAIPPGSARTYGDVANEIGSSARAVGTACGHNPIPVIVPCHRIVGASGLGGFMGFGKGDTINIKQWLLQHEGAVAKPRQASLI